MFHSSGSFVNSHFQLGQTRTNKSRYELTSKSLYESFLNSRVQREQELHES